MDKFLYTILYLRITYWKQLIYVLHLGILNKCPKLDRVLEGNISKETKDRVLAKAQTQFLNAVAPLSNVLIQFILRGGLIWSSLIVLIGSIGGKKLCEWVWYIHDF